LRIYNAVHYKQILVVLNKQRDLWSVTVDRIGHMMAAAIQ